MYENQMFSVRFTKGSGCVLGSRNCGNLDATNSLATEGLLHGRRAPLGVQRVLCTVATLKKRSFYYIGYQEEKSRTPPFK